MSRECETTHGLFGARFERRSNYENSTRKIDKGIREHRGRISRARVQHCDEHREQCDGCKKRREWLAALHIIVFVLLGWWLFLLPNLGYLVYSRIAGKDEVLIRVGAVTVSDIPIVFSVAALCACVVVLLVILIAGIASRIIGGSASPEDLLYGGILVALFGEGAWALFCFRSGGRLP